MHHFDTSSVIIHVPKPEQTLLDDFGNVTLSHLVDRGEEVFFGNINRCG